MSKAHSAHEGLLGIVPPPAPHTTPRLIFGLLSPFVRCCGMGHTACGLRLNRAGDGPNETHHLAGYGDIDDIGCLAASPQASIASAQPNLRFPSDVADDLWQRLGAVDLMTADARPHSVGPCAFNQRAADVTVRGLRDTAAPNGLATRSLSGDKAETTP